MTPKEKRKLRTAFFRQAGPNAEMFTEMFEAVPEMCLNIKDRFGRFMALNRRNCEVSNIRDEWDAIGLLSTDIFPAPYAKTYMALDAECRDSGHPVLNRVTEFPTDRSDNLMVSNLFPIRNRAGHVIGTLHIYRITPKDDTTQRIYTRMRAVSQHILANLGTDIRLETLAAIAGLSLSTFKRTFQRTFNVTPGRYILTARLNAARKLLEETDRRTTDIAQECGFYDQSHFIKTFFRERGITPGEHRRRHASDSSSATQ